MVSSSPLLLSCPDCSARMPETAGFCPACGRPIRKANRVDGKVGPLPEGLAGGLAYFTFIPAILFLVIDPYKRNHFVRYHAIQCLLLSVAVFGAAAVVKVIALLFSFVPVVGPLFAVLVAMMAGLAAFLLWAVLVVKAFQGEMFKLPVIGDLAERYAGKA